jgi:hypothetical protein
VTFPGSSSNSIPKSEGISATWVGEVRPHPDFDKTRIKMGRYRGVMHADQVGSFSGTKGESKRLSSQNLIAPDYLKVKGVNHFY